MTILSIQSHVAAGHVGLQAAVLPLQRLGYDVIAVPTVVFSNHPGHGTFRGMALGATELEEILTGLEQHGAIQEVHAIHTGYLDSAQQADIVWKFIQRLREKKIMAPFFCDPVMGDRDKGLYVGKDLAEFLRLKAPSMAEALFPNQFELEYLTGRTISTLDDALNACDSLRAKGTRAVVATSLHLQDQFPEGLCAIAVADEGAYLGAVPLLQHTPKGAGDLLCACFIGRSLKHESLPMALSHALTSTHRILELSVRGDSKELLIVEGQDFCPKPGNLVAVHQVR
jgi:pyridoxine kinase